MRADLLCAIQMRRNELFELALVLLCVSYAVAIIALLFSGSDALRYRNKVNEQFQPELHELLDSERQCRGDECENVPSVWRDEGTQTIYRRNDFDEHRRHEAWRLALNWFLLGSVGCVLGAWFQMRRDPEKFASRLALFLAGNAVSAFVVALQLL